MPDAEWPRLSLTLTGPWHPQLCARCGGSDDLSRWQEHDALDVPEPVVVVLCVACALAVVEPHPRLYAQLDPYQPWPGCMPVCADCTLRDGTRCTSPAAKANGGPGVLLTMPLPSTGFVHYRDARGRRRGKRRTLWKGPVTACKQRVPAGPATPEPARCKSCRAEILWVKAASGKTMPLDAEPAADGNIVEDVGGTFRVLSKVERALPATGPRYRSHHSTCPQAQDWRRNR